MDTSKHSDDGPLPPLMLRGARWRAISSVMVFLFVLMLVYELLKTWAFPTLTLWGSHAITIVFATCLGTFATWAALRWNDRLDRRLRAEAVRRQQLQEESAHLMVRASELERINQRLATEIDERRLLEAQLVHAQKMESIGRLAGGIAHDFNNLLFVIMNSVYLAQAAHARGEAIDADLAAVNDASTRAARLTQQLLAFARHQPHAPRTIDLHALIRSATDVLDRLVGATLTVRLALDAPRAMVQADPANMEQVLFNLVVNAADAMPLGGEIVIRTTTQSTTPDAANPGRQRIGESICLEVVDHGHGISRDAHARLFEPFFTTKAAGEGTGLGLATSYGIVARAGGIIEAFNNADRGATFRVVLPLTHQEAEADPLPDAPPPPRGTGTILVAEDEPGVLEIARRTLEDGGYEVLVAADGEEAIARASDFSGIIDLLLTDVVMPRVGGREIAIALRRSRPNMQVVFMSGYTDVAVVGTSEHADSFLQKPFTMNELLRHVGAVLRV